MFYQQGWLVWLHAFLGPHRGRHQCRGYHHSYWALCWLCRCFFLLQTLVVSWIWPEPSPPPVHICHAFLTVSGSKRERAHAALLDMGPAVLNGGLSTLIAFILLLSSDSYFFLTFFKIFFLTVLFGVWHGLVLLPVLLSLVGPGAYSSARCNEKKTICIGENILWLEG